MSLVYVGEVHCIREHADLTEADFGQGTKLDKARTGASIRIVLQALRAGVFRLQPYPTALT
jgi:hypothetical protein